MNSLSALHKKLELLQKRTRSIIALHEINRIFWQTDVLSEQIPESYAAGAYITMRQALIRHEAILLMSLWDGRKNDYGILSILKDSAEIAEEIKDYIFAQRAEGITPNSYSFSGDWTDEQKRNIRDRWLNQDIDDAISDAEKSTKYLQKLHGFLKYKYQKIGS